MEIHTDPCWSSTKHQRRGTTGIPEDAEMTNKPSLYFQIDRKYNEVEDKVSSKAYKRTKNTKESKEN